MRHILTAEKEYTRLSELASEHIPFLSLAMIKQQIRAGEVRVNGIKVSHDCPLLYGDELRLFLPRAFEPDAPVVETIYVDDQIIIVAKPILCETETHLTSLVQQQYGFAAAVHRLDRNTAGLVMFARSAKVESELLRLMKLHKIEKTYRALVYGPVSPPERAVRVFLKKDAATAIVKVSDTPRSAYLTADLAYRTIERVGEDTLLDIRLLTGRTHQIRATMAHLGNPILGDGKYGIESVNRARHAKYQKLYAYKIEFDFDASESALLGSLSRKQIIWKNYEFYKNI